MNDQEENYAPYYTESRQVTSDDRILFPKKQFPTWTTNQKLILFPLRYYRVFDFDEDLHLFAWGLIDPHTQTENWEINLNDIHADERSNLNAQDLVSFIFEVKLQSTKQDWRLKVPTVIRNQNWLPAPNEKVFIKNEIFGVSFWTKDTFQALALSAIETWPK